MNKTMIRRKVFKSACFRTPCGIEAGLGLWVDRIGKKYSRSTPEDMKSLRILGLHAAIAILSGKGVFESTLTGLVQVGKGDVIMVFPDEPSYYWPDSQWEECSVVWGGPEADLILGTKILSPCFPVFRNAGRHVLDAYGRVSSLMTSESSLAALERKDIILQMIIKLGGEISGKSREREGQLPRGVAQVLSTLASSQKSPLPISALIRGSGMSPSHFRRMFKQHTGKSPKDFTVSMRVNNAKRLLAEGFCIKDVAQKCGFADVFHFMRTFKKITGCTASQYSKAL